MPTTDIRAAPQTLAERATLALRELVHDGVLLPGQPIRQAVVAEQLGISRIPVREALKNLQADGLVEASPSGGFVVARLSAAELTEIYLMRRLLETELLQRITSVSNRDIAALVELNARMADQIDRPTPELRGLNQDFHFRMFRLSGLTYVVTETARLWDKTSPYRLVYSVEREARVRIVEEHDRLIEALRRGDLRSLVRDMDEHRGTGAREVISVLSHPLSTVSNSESPDAG